jgi:hypothetical protein
MITLRTSVLASHHVAFKVYGQLFWPIHAAFLPYGVRWLSVIEISNKRLMPATKVGNIAQTAIVKTL